MLCMYEMQETYIYIAGRIVHANREQFLKQNNCITNTFYLSNSNWQLFQKNVNIKVFR